MIKKYLFNTLLLIIIVFAFLAFLPADAALVGNTNQATLNVNPATGTFNANDTFAVSIYVNTNNQNAVGVSAYFTYDKTHFEATSIDTTGSVFTIEWEKIIDSANGKIKISRTIPTPGVNTSNGLVAKINFKALSSVTPVADNLTFDFTPGVNTNSQVILDDGRGTNILSGVNNAKFQVGSGGPISYPNGTLLRANNSDRVYLIESNQKRWIPTAEIFNSYEYLWSSILVVEPSVINGFIQGSDISISATHLSEGALIRAKDDIDVYIVKYVGNKKLKRLILSPSVFNNYGHLKWSDIKEVEQNVVDSFMVSDLVQAENDTRVYKLYPSGDTGQKRWIKTLDVFVRMGFDWDAIYKINSFDRDSYIEAIPLE